MWRLVGLSLTSEVDRKYGGASESRVDWVWMERGVGFVWGAGSLFALTSPPLTRSNFSLAPISNNDLEIKVSQSVTSPGAVFPFSFRSLFHPYRPRWKVISLGGPGASFLSRSFEIHPESDE